MFPLAVCTSTAIPPEKFWLVQRMGTTLPCANVWPEVGEVRVMEGWAEVVGAIMVKVGLFAVATT